MYEKLTTEKRSLEREHSAKKLRSQGIVPGVIYGKEIDSLPIMVPQAKLSKFLGKAGRVFEVEVEGGKTHLVHLDSIQKDHMGNHTMHIAFHKLQAGQKTTVSLPIHWVGTPVGQIGDNEGVLHHSIDELEVEGLPKDIPEYIEVDVSSLDINDSLHLSDLTPPQGCEFTEDETRTLASCQPPRPEEEPEEAVSPADTPEVQEGEEGEEGEASSSEESSREKGSENSDSDEPSPEEDKKAS